MAYDCKTVLNKMSVTVLACILLHSDEIAEGRFAKVCWHDIKDGKVMTQSLLPQHEGFKAQLFLFGPYNFMHYSDM